MYQGQADSGEAGRIHGNASPWGSSWCFATQVPRGKNRVHPQGCGLFLPKQNQRVEFLGGASTPLSLAKPCSSKKHNCGQHIFRQKALYLTKKKKKKMGVGEEKL